MCAVLHVYHFGKEGSWSVVLFLLTKSRWVIVELVGGEGSFGLRLLMARSVFRKEKNFCDSSSSHHPLPLPLPHHPDIMMPKRWIVKSACGLPFYIYKQVRPHGFNFLAFRSRCSERFGLPSKIDENRTEFTNLGETARIGLVDLPRLLCETEMRERIVCVVAVVSLVDTGGKSRICFDLWTTSLTNFIQCSDCSWMIAIRIIHRVAEPSRGHGSTRLCRCTLVVFVLVLLVIGIIKLIPSVDDLTLVSHGTFARGNFVPRRGPTLTRANPPRTAQGPRTTTSIGLKRA